MWSLLTVLPRNGRIAFLLLFSGFSPCVWLLTVWLCCKLAVGLFKCMLLGFYWGSWMWRLSFHQICKGFSHCSWISSCSFLVSFSSPSTNILVHVTVSCGSWGRFLFLPLLFCPLLSSYNAPPCHYVPFPLCSPVHICCWAPVVSFHSVTLLFNSKICIYMIILFWYYLFNESSSTSL